VSTSSLTQASAKSLKCSTMSTFRVAVSEYQ
jgi:hypothetical protein